MMKKVTSFPLSTDVYNDLSKVFGSQLSLYLVQGQQQEIRYLLATEESSSMIKSHISLIILK